MTAKHSKVRGRAIAFMSARGGVGKTALSAQTGLLFANAGVSTALLDLDIQFGDLDFIFDELPQHTLLDLCMTSNLDVAQVPRFAHAVTPNLDLYISGSKPEHADFVIPHAASLIRALRLHYDMVVVNTGAFWSTLQAEVIEAAALCFLVFDARAVSLRMTLRVRELVARLGVPAAKIAYLLNHTRAQNEIEVFDASMVLGTNDIVHVPYGGVAVSDLMSIGRAQNLLNEASVSASALEAALQKKGLLPNEGNGLGDAIGSRGKADLDIPLAWMAEEPLLVGEQR